MIRHRGVTVEGVFSTDQGVVWGDFCGVGFLDSPCAASRWPLTRWDRWCAHKRDAGARTDGARACRAKAWRAQTRRLRTVRAHRWCAARSESDVFVRRRHDCARFFKLGWGFSAENGGVRVGYPRF